MNLNVFKKLLKVYTPSNVSLYLYICFSNIWKFLNFSFNPFFFKSFFSLISTSTFIFIKKATVPASNLSKYKYKKKHFKFNRFLGKFRFRFSFFFFWICKKKPTLKNKNFFFSKNSKTIFYRYRFFFKKFKYPLVGFKKLYSSFMLRKKKKWFERVSTNYKTRKYYKLLFKQPKSYFRQRLLFLLTLRVKYKNLKYLFRLFKRFTPRRATKPKHNRPYLFLHMKKKSLSKIKSPSKFLYTKFKRHKKLFKFFKKQNYWFRKKTFRRFSQHKITKIFQPSNPAVWTFKHKNHKFLSTFRKKLIFFKYNNNDYLKPIFINLKNQQNFLKPLKNLYSFLRLKRNKTILIRLLFKKTKKLSSFLYNTTNIRFFMRSRIKLFFKYSQRRKYKKRIFLRKLKKFYKYSTRLLFNYTFFLISSTSSASYSLVYPTQKFLQLNFNKPTINKIFMKTNFQLFRFKHFVKKKTCL